MFCTYHPEVEMIPLRVQDIVWLDNSEGWSKDPNDWLVCPICNTMKLKRPNPLTVINREDLVEALKRVIQEHKVSSYWIASMRKIGYTEEQDNWVNVCYIEEWLKEK